MQRPATRLTAATLLALIAAAGIAGAAEPEPASPYRILLLTGRNNHNWRETTPALQKLLEATGRFAVVTTVPPAGLASDNLKRFDVILSNWNSWGAGSDEAEAEWSHAARRAYLDFVRQGKGHVTVHAGGSSFYQGWPEYRQVALVYWDLGSTSHGRPHAFRVRIDRPEHPLAKGLGGFSLLDELWNRPGVVPGARVLASAYSDTTQDAKGTGRWEPVAVTATYGAGRCFATLLGHDARALQNEGVRDLLIRGVRWAAGDGAPPP